MIARTITNTLLGIAFLFFGTVSTADNRENSWMLQEQATSSWSWAKNSQNQSPYVDRNTTVYQVPRVIDAVVIITSFSVREEVPAPSSTEQSLPPRQDPEEPAEEDNSLNDFLENSSISNHFNVTSQGTGFFIGPNLIVTNQHVIKGGVQDEFIVSLYKRLPWYKARVIASDEKTDLAILEIIEPDEIIENIVPLKFASTLPLLGEKLFAIGHPHSLYWSVTEGVTSNVNRRIKTPWQVLIQTDTSLNPGNSGGPLFNMKGEVIGVNVLLLGKDPKNDNPVDSGLNFAVRGDLTQHVIKELKEYNRVRRPRIGLMVKNRPGKDTRGIIIGEVNDDSPASKANLRADDIITHANDIEIPTTYDFFAWFVEQMPGDVVIFRVERDTQFNDGPDTIIVNIPVTLEELIEK